MAKGKGQKSHVEISKCAAVYISKCVQLLMLLEEEHISFFTSTVIKEVNFLRPLLVAFQTSLVSVDTSQ